LSVDESGRVIDEGIFDARAQVLDRPEGGQVERADRLVVNGGGSISAVVDLGAGARARGDVAEKRPFGAKGYVRRWERPTPKP
jgi:hypothetical protein